VCQYSWLIHMSSMTMWVNMSAMTQRYDSVCQYSWPRPMTHSCMCHDSFMHMPWLFHACAMTSACEFHDSLMRVPWHIHACAVTYSYEFHDSFICMNESWNSLESVICLYHDSFIWVPWLIDTSAMTHSCICHDTFIWVPNSCIWIPWLVDTSAVTHSYERLIQTNRAPSRYLPDLNTLWSGFDE